ncbi:MAG: hypothetical protein ACOY4K_14855 [Pseudomonadota bacterium]
MTDRLDSLLAQLRDAPGDHDLHGLEGDVRRRLARRTDAWAAVGVPAHAAAVALAMLLGAGVGGYAAVTTDAPPHPSAFASASALAPSTLLGGG